MKITVITVAFNAGNLLEKTIKNVLEQTYSDIEYWIIDGKSADQSLQILEKYAAKIKYVSEKDKGIYDAMNKGIRLATGEWLIFMNAGDLFDSPNVIEKVFAQKTKADLIYGDYRIAYTHFSKYKFVPKNLKIDSFSKGMPLNHQSIFLKTELAKQFLFSENYRLAADFEQLLSIFLANKKLHYSNVCIANFLDGGISSSKKILYLEECCQIISQQIPDQSWKKTYKKEILKTKIIDFIKKLLPVFLFEKLMQIKNS